VPSGPGRRDSNQERPDHDYERDQRTAEGHKPKWMYRSDLLFLFVFVLFALRFLMSALGLVMLMMSFFSVHCVSENESVMIAV